MPSRQPPVSDGTFTPNFVGAQGYPQGPQVDPWAQTWVRPVALPVGRAAAGVPGWPGPAHPPSVPMPPSMPMPAQTRRAQRRWAVIGTVSAAVAVVTACTGVLIAVASTSNAPAGTTTVTESAGPTPSPSATTTAAPAAVVPIDALPGLLLDPATVNGIEGASGMVIRPDPNAGNGSGFADIRTDRPECLGIAHPAMLAALQGSGWIAAQTQVLREPSDDWKHLVSNAVIDFPSVQLANDYAAKQAEAWARCTGKPLTANAIGEGPVTWSVGPTTNRDGIASVVLTQEGAAGWACQRAMTVRDNIVVDARSCGFNRSEQAVTIATKIAERVHAPDQ